MLMLYSTKRVTVKKKMHRATIILPRPKQLYSKLPGDIGGTLWKMGAGQDRNPQFGRRPMCRLMLASSAHSEENITFFLKSKAFTLLPRKSMSYCTHKAVEVAQF